MTKPKGVITPDEARTLDAAFNSRHELISDSIVKRPDNRSSWWSLQDVKDYLAYAENQAKEQGYTMNGIRVYLGAYPDEKDQVGYTTMFMVPTGVKNGEPQEKGYSSEDGNRDNPDLLGSDGLNRSESGNPPSSNYPQ